MPFLNYWSLADISGPIWIALEKASIAAYEVTSYI
jgi:hypothetical protein